MQPELAQKLMKNKDIVDFVDFLTKKVGELDTITDIEWDIDIEPAQLTVEVRARKLANTKLKEILEPLLNSRSERGEINKQEYIT